MKTNVELRAAARTRLGGNIFGNFWMVGLVAVVVYSILSTVLSAVPLGFLLVGPLTVALAAFFLSLSRTGVGDIATMIFPIKSSERFIHTLLVGLFTMLFTFLWSLLFIIPGIVKSYAYAMAPYIAIEREDLDARECLAESSRLMEGHKWQLFILDLSFIGWYLLGAIICGIGVYFVDPYRHAARAEFYCALVGAPEAAYDVQAEDIAEDNGEGSDEEITK